MSTPNDLPANMSTQRRERRLRLVFIPAEWVRFLLTAGIKWQAGDRPQVGKIQLPNAAPDLPRDAEIVSLLWAPDHDSFVVILASAEWEPVPIGTPVPPLPTPVWETAKVLLVQEA